ncbi:MAG: hypothetical protein ACKVOI_03390 [Dongiaceae bacterium]
MNPNPPSLPLSAAGEAESQDGVDLWLLENQPAAAAPPPPANPAPAGTDDQPYILQSLPARMAEEALLALRMTSYVPRHVVARRCAITAATMEQAEPLDEIEGMLLAQMVAAHSRGMGLIHKSLDPATLDGRQPDIQLLTASRLLTLARRQAYARMRYRDWLEERARRAKDGRRKPRKRKPQGGKPQGSKP